MATEDLRVESLTYVLTTNPYTAFSEDAQTVTLEGESFIARLERGILNVTIKDDFTTDFEARQAVEPHLQEWEMVAALHNLSPLFSFRFESSSITNRAAPPGTHDVRLGDTFHFSDSLSERHRPQQLSGAAL
jgi:hypothetical protein